jgi:hypothetical protein
MITKGQRYREILAILARHGIGVVDDHFIKLGQVLSTRGDLLPDAYRTELGKLQDEVAPLPATAIAEVIREDLGAPPDQLFASFDLKPLASASIGQVHAPDFAMVGTWCSKYVSPGSMSWSRPTSRFWPVSSMSGLRVFQCSTKTTHAACCAISATLSWRSSTMDAKTA